MDGCTIIIFGATGDLARKKLVPALYRLEAKGSLTKETRILCIGRRGWDNNRLFKEYRPVIGKDIFKKKYWNSFKKKLIYHDLEFNDAEAYDRLRKKVKDLPSSTKRIFYLATPQEAFDDIVGHLARTKLAEDTPRKGWHRVVFEKPFGSDLKSARALNREVTKLFREEQIYRIDHYIGKSFVQELFSLRFANPIFENQWSAKHISSVEIAISETVSVEDRGSYYDEAGAIRDMLQNHLMQLLSLVAMEPPKTLGPKDIRDTKVSVLKNVVLPPKNQVKKYVVCGQYTQGTAGNKHVADYTKERNVDSDSDTETFVATELYINNSRWQGVPFYLWTGKALDKKYAEIRVRFKPGDWITLPGPSGKATGNTLFLRIQPEEGLKLEINFSKGEYGVAPQILDFTRPAKCGLNSTEAYEHLLGEVIKGDQALFTRWDFVENSWKIADRLREGCDTLHTYKAGTKGPLAAIRMLR